TGSAQSECVYPIWSDSSPLKEPWIESGFQFFDQGLSEPGGRGRAGNAGRFHRGGLGAGIALAAGDDGAGMAHAAAGRRGDAGDEADHRLLAAAFGLVLEELGGVFLGRAADLADHDDRGGVVVT